MKVGLYIPSLDYGSVAGPVKYQVNVARALLNVGGVELYLVHHRGVSHVPVQARQIIIRRNTRILWELKLGKHHLDIIHFNTIPTTRRTFFPILSCKKVVTVHGDLHWLKDMCPDYDCRSFRLRRLIEPWSSKFMDAVISVSNDLRDRLVRFLKVPGKRIKVVYEGVSPVYTPIQNAGYVKSKYKICRPFIFHASNLSPKKNPVILLKAFRELIKRGFKLQMVMTGRMRHNAHVKSMTEKLGLVSHVRMLGYVPEPDLISLYNSAELFVFPSLHETFGLPVIEAMACGTPVVASNAYSIPEIAGDAAILCNPLDYIEFADAMEHVLENRDIKERMKTQGLSNAKRFTWEKCAMETARIYRQILD